MDLVVQLQISQYGFHIFSPCSVHKFSRQKFSPKIYITEIHKLHCLLEKSLPIGTLVMRCTGARRELLLVSGDEYKNAQ